MPETICALEGCENKCQKPGNTKTPLKHMCSHFSVVEVNNDAKGPGRYGPPRYYCSGRCLFRDLYRIGKITDSEYYAKRERPKRAAEPPKFELDLEEAV